MKKKLAIITTHPIQYNAPWFQLLAKRNNIEVKVIYTWSQSKTSVKDKNFGKQITWDIPLLEDYDYEFIENSAKDPGPQHETPFLMLCTTSRAGKGLTLGTLLPGFDNTQENAG